MRESKSPEKSLILEQISAMIDELSREPEQTEKDMLARTAEENGFNSSNVPSSFIDQAYQALNDRHNVIYEFVMRYNDYIYAGHDYGNGHPLSMIEVHTLTYIQDHPGTTVTELTNYWHKTKGAVSQIVSHLEDLGLVEKTKKRENGKNVYLYITEAGFRISCSHKLYDILDITKTLSKVQRECTPAEIDTFYKVLSVYYKVICKDFEENKIPRRQGRRRQEKEY